MPPDVYTQRRRGQISPINPFSSAISNLKADQFCLIAASGDTYDTKFFLLKVQAFRIGESPPAPLFTIEAGPSVERVSVGKVKKEIAEGENSRFQFFDQLLAKSNAKKNCWEFMECGLEPNGLKAAELGVCPASIDKSYNGINNGTNAGRFCWKISGPLCSENIKGRFSGDLISCLLCPFFEEVKNEEGKNFR